MARGIGEGTPPDFQVRSLDKHRIEGLIDGVFAVVLTLLVLDIKVPEGVSFASNAELWARLLQLERHFAIYVISFIVIAIYWVAHHVQFHYVRYTDRRLIWLNMLFLLLISFLPFATDLIGDHEDLILPCIVYGITLLSLSGISYLHLRYLARHPYLATDDLNVRAVRLLRRRIGIFALIPTVSMITSFYSTHLALYAYALIITVHFLPGHINEPFYAKAVAHNPWDEPERP